MTDMTNTEETTFFGHYMLIDGEPVICKDIQEWSDWSCRSYNFDDLRRVGKTTLPNGIFISTVFLGIDHNWGDGPPMLWETMVFGKSGTWRVKLKKLWCKIIRVHYIDYEGDIQERCSGNWDDAKKMHKAMVVRMRGW